MFDRRQNLPGILLDIMMLNMFYPRTTIVRPLTDEEWNALEADRMRRDHERRVASQHEQERIRAAYEAAAAPIRAERLRRKAENFARRQPKKK